MSSNDANDRKRKPTYIVPASVPSNDDGRNPKEKKARRVSTTNASASNAASLQVDAFVAAIANTVPAASEDGASIESMGIMIQDLFSSDNTIVHAALDALNKDLDKDKKKCHKVQALGGCLALVLLIKNFLDKTIERIPACDQVTNSNVPGELTIIRKAFTVIMRLTYHHKESKVGIAAIGGVEAVVKVMKTFPKCQYLQAYACATLTNLACCSVGIAKAIESGGIEVLLAAINNHLNSSFICERACSVLVRIVSDSKENTGRLIILGGGAAVAKVIRKWPESQVRQLSDLIGSEMKAWAHGLD
jgi:hypothetical protein